MNKHLKRFLIFTAILVLIIALLVCYVLFVVIKQPTKIQDITQAPLNQWNRIELDDTVVSSDGSDYYLLTKKGSSNNVMIYFSGGGANWDEKTADSPITIFNMMQGKYNYFSRIPYYKLATMGGILKDDNPDNPFNDWTIIYVPYTTGDFHIGDNLIEYRDDLSVIHNGKKNVQAALAWTYQNIQNPDKLLIAGESAGGFATAFWTPEISDHYPQTPTYAYIDSSNITTERWPTIIDQTWNADFENTFGYKPQADLIASALEYNLRNYPSITFLQSSTMYDVLLMSFESQLNQTVIDDTSKQAWSSAMKKTLQDLGKYDNYYSFITNEGKTGIQDTTHTISPANSFYTFKANGIPFVEWLSDAVINDAPQSLSD
ncbi:hypothetical protein G7062_00260 [Erysipelothrix sp. HDW6C]|uniref:pectin acetylesterase-family hydrolase n=1 Tax=Erysipelothrix sp. HDW6C TaxID=2714930 RepID=UPI00140E1E4C|nr:pectin acetylesterase-family hydrolase [Erysipelothrix sp. HDW6C]QIK68807.1 hypothetical protein G7062_00260 [Erysipelothrix sp. HDW6C]